MGNNNWGSLIQYRCPACGRKLFTYRVGDSKLEWKDPWVKEIKTQTGYEMICTKCKTRLALTGHKLTIVEIEEAQLQEVVSVS